MKNILFSGFFSFSDLNDESTDEVQQTTPDDYYYYPRCFYGMLTTPEFRWMINKY